MGKQYKVLTNSRKMNMRTHWLTNFFHPLSLVHNFQRSEEWSLSLQFIKMALTGMCSVEGIISQHSAAGEYVCSDFFKWKRTGCF